MKVTRALLDLLTGTIPPKCPILPVISTPGLTRAVLNLPAGKIKTRSVEGVILALENLYNSRISRNQQDSQEFLHLIHEALDTEDQNLKKRAGNETLVIPPNPFEGTLATQITCLRCAFTTPSKKEAFTELSLAVPSKWTCGLGECLNSVLTTDRIPDYACPSCTLENTLHVLELIPTKPAPLLRATSRLRALQNQLKDPHHAPLDIDAVKLPPSVKWQTAKVPATKKTVLSAAPKVLVLHLVRSVYERGYGAGRNGCEVEFEEDIGVVVDGEDVERRRIEEAVEDDEYSKRYRLMSVVTHRGGHDSGHYICYRRRRRGERKARRPRSSESNEGPEQVEEKPDGAEGDERDESEGLVVGLGLEDERLAKWEGQPFSRTKWWETSDESVVGVHVDNVVSKRKGVYLLFYERTL
jgi:ubiquitin carboxyl-terminal hydrolase 16